MMSVALLLFLLFQEPRAEESASEEKRIDLDFSDQYKMLSNDLEKSLRWKKLFGIFGIAQVHIYPGRESGPNLGPPLRIWGNGFGASLWRDPVTGWPLQ
jgi:hypothetical protein